MGIVLHDIVAHEHVSNSDGNLSDEGEHLCDCVGKSEFEHVLDVKEETVPSGIAEGVSGDGHVSVGSFVDIVANLFKTGENAVGTNNYIFDNWVVC